MIPREAPESTNIPLTLALSRQGRGNKMALLETSEFLAVWRSLMGFHRRFRAILAGLQRVLHGSCAFFGDAR